MARIEKMNRGLSSQLDEIEQRTFVLKMTYEKYFAGLERIEPARERDEIKRIVRECGKEQIRNATQRFKYEGLKARFQMLELYWTRNLVMMERGTHPKMKFKADAKDRERAAREAQAAERAGVASPAMAAAAEAAQVLQERAERTEREEAAYKIVYARYIEAREKCGQSTDLSFDAVREALHKQVRTIKSTYNCESVKFRIVVEEGKAKVKALPQNAAGAPPPAPR